MLGNHLEQLIIVPPPSVLNPLGKFIHLSRSLISPLPYIVRAHVSRAMNDAVNHALRDSTFDILHCDSISAVPAMPAKNPISKVFNAHNVEAQIWERYVREERRRHLLPLLKLQCAKVSAYESTLPRIFNACATVSEEDRCQMQQRYGFTDVHVVKNGVDLDYYPVTPDPLTDTIAFIGSLDWRPNQDAVTFFAKSILPLIRAARPSVTVSVIGRRPPRNLSRLCARSGIALQADVADVRPYLIAASLVIVPLRIGGGSRLKILEALAAGRCVVSTTIGAEGLAVEAGKHLLIADDPTDFARLITTLLADPTARHSIAAAGRSLVESEYSWDRISLDMENVWLTAAGVSTDQSQG